MPLPIQEQQGVTLQACTPLAAVATCLIAQGGCRPATIGNKEGTDGLTHGDLIDARLEGTELVFDRVLPDAESWAEFLR